MPSSAARRGGEPTRPSRTSGTQTSDAGADRDQPVAERRVVAAARGVGDSQEGDQGGDDEDGGADVDAADPLPGEPGAERQREDDAGDQQRLHDRQPADPQRRRLGDEAERVGGDPGQPDRPPRHPQQQARAGALGGRFEPGPLLQDGAEREQQRRDEGENYVHLVGLRSVAGRRGPHHMRCRARRAGLLQFSDQRKEVVLILSHMLEGTLEVQGR